MDTDVVSNGIICLPFVIGVKKVAGFDVVVGIFGPTLAAIVTPDQTALSAALIIGFSLKIPSLVNFLISHFTSIRALTSSTIRVSHPNVYK